MKPGQLRIIDVPLMIGALFAVAWVSRHVQSTDAEIGILACVGGGPIAYGRNQTEGIMHYNGPYYTANTLSEAMMRHDVSNHRPALSKSEEIVSATVRHLILLPAYFIVFAIAAPGRCIRCPRTARLSPGFSGV